MFKNAGLLSSQKGTVRCLGFPGYNLTGRGTPGCVANRSGAWIGPRALRGKGAHSARYATAAQSLINNMLMQKEKCAICNVLNVESKSKLKQAVTQRGNGTCMTILEKGTTQKSLGQRLVKLFITSAMGPSFGLVSLGCVGLISKNKNGFF